MRVASIMLIPLLVSGCLVRGTPISPYGREVTLVGPHERISGELIAVASDTIWVLGDAGLRAKRLTEERRIDVRRHNFGFGRTMRWMLTAGLATGGALMISCQSYESSDDGSGDSATCLAVVPMTGLVFAGFGLLFGSINEYTTVHRVAPAESGRLQGFSRYPQGLPDTLRRHPLIPPNPRP
jgi:hypothetical protein